VVDRDVVFSSLKTKLNKMKALLIFLFVIASVKLALYAFSKSKKQNTKKRKIQQAILDEKNQKKAILAVTSQNKWLHPNDSLGMLEKGVVHEATTYVYEDGKDGRIDFEILSKKE
jgi:preprotein translocase subunit SecG